MKTTLSIIGCGHVGKVLARLWTESRTLSIAQILNRSLSSGEQAVRFIGAGSALTRDGELLPADLFLIGTPDDQISHSAERLAASGVLGPTSIVFHCSGSLSSAVLQVAAGKGAAVASIHPVRSFASPDEVMASFDGTWCGMEGNRRALETLAPLFRTIGAQLVLVNPQSKMLYHAAAVFASNYLVTVLDVALEAYAEAGIPRETALHLIAPLARKTVDNVLAIGPEKALSGPIARGDIATVESQYQAVREWSESSGQLYQVLADRTAELARRRNRNDLSTETVKKPVDKN